MLSLISSMAAATVTFSVTAAPMPTMAEPDLPRYSLKATCQSMCMVDHVNFVCTTKVHSISTSSRVKVQTLCKALRTGILRLLLS